MRFFELNLVLAWIWILLGLLSGLLLGMFFHRENWLGGYASLKRRLYRLCHISFFGLGILNLCFVLTVQSLNLSTPLLHIASWALISGAILMPACCLIMAHLPAARLLFGLPVFSLVLAGSLIVVALIESAQNQSAATVAKTAGQVPSLTAHN